MEITDILGKMGGLGSIARELGVSEAQAAQGVDALAPAILGGLKKQAKAQPSGLDGLGGLLGQLGGGGLLDNVLAQEPTDVGRGNDVLGQIFGSKDVSRTVAQSAATRSGLDSDLLKKMLPMLAMAVTGYMAKQQSGPSPARASASPVSGSPSAALSDILGNVLGGQATAASTPRAGGGGLGSLLDMDGDGNPLDDILNMAKRAMR